MTIKLSSCRIGQNLAATWMLDTVTIEGAWRLKMECPAGRKVPLHHKVRGWADALGQTLARVETSLPRLLFGHNGRVIKDQCQLNAALEKLREIVSQWAEVPAVNEWRASRVDIAWNFNIPTSPLVIGHSGLRIPGIRQGANTFDGMHGLSWKGAKSKLLVRIYDKARKMRVPGTVTRVEVSLRGEQLAKRVQGDWRDFRVLWRTYMCILASIPPIPKPVQCSSLLEAIGLEPQEVRDRILARLAHKPKRTFRNYRQRAAAAAAHLPETFSWAKILPVDGPPPPLDVKKS